MYSQSMYSTGRFDDWRLAVFRDETVPTYVQALGDPDGQGICGALSPSAGPLIRCDS